MGYYYTTESENAVPAKSWAQPKTHTPGSRVKERGHRYYQPEVGRWVSRDPVDHIARFREVYEDLLHTEAVQASLQNSNVAWYFLYLYVGNIPTMLVDFVGLSPSGKCCALPDDPYVGQVTDCDSVCKAYIAKPGAKLNGGGGVICHGRLKCACPFPIWGVDPGECPEVDAITKKHEEGHFGSHTCDPTKCLDRPGFNKGVDEDAEECLLRKKSILDLKNLVGVIPPKNPKCEEFKKKLIKELEEWVAANCPDKKK